ncbi:MAG: cellulose biosynthesis cyclic di-GMP-binding regulatory protein BcsB, partial [Cyanobacteria bacterium REEB65]|nr:cellulose biosynthesis cyclic di-GMP-binding regulatory protein BcsB [Cyanobacteria bacterium REEB65]
YLLTLSAMVLGLKRAIFDNADRGISVVTLIWESLNLLILNAANCVFFERRQRRANPRIEIDLPATLQVGESDAMACTLRDISVGGAFLQVAGPLALAAGEPLSLALRIPALGLPARLSATALVTRGLPQQQTGVGIRFECSTLSERKAVVALAHGDSEVWRSIQLSRIKSTPGIAKSFFFLAVISSRVLAGPLAALVKDASHRVRGAVRQHMVRKPTPLPSRTVAMIALVGWLLGGFPSLSQPARAATSSVPPSAPGVATSAAALAPPVASSPPPAGLPSPEQDHRDRHRHHDRRHHDRHDSLRDDTVRAHQRTQILRLPLAKFALQVGPIYLRRAFSSSTLDLPLDRREVVESARLHLVYQNSEALVSGRSELSVLIGDQVVHQIALSGFDPTGIVDLRLPADLLQAVFNKISFQAIQHYTTGYCEDTFAPELWTQIDTARSAFILKIRYPALHPRLADLDDLFSDKELATPSYTVLSPDPVPQDPALLEAGNLMAQGVAIRLKFIPGVFHYAQATRLALPDGDPDFPGLDENATGAGDVLLYGTRQALAPYISNDLANRIQGPFLGVYALAAEPSRVLVLASGLTPSEVKEAAGAFALIGFPFPQTAEALVRGIAYPRWADYASRTDLQPGHTYPFSELGYHTRTLDGYDGDSADLTFSMPHGLLPTERGNIIAHLHFANGAGMRKDSVINVMLNRHLQTAVLIEGDHAAAYNDYRVLIPVQSLRSGPNTLSFQPSFLPLVSGNCSPVRANNLVATLFDDSTLEIPTFDHLVTMPDLQLLGQTGFPYTAKPNGGDTVMWLTDRDPQTVGAAYTLSARIAQNTGLPMFGEILSYDLPAEAHQLMVIGSTGHLPTTLENLAPVSFTAEQSVAYPDPVLYGRPNRAPGWLSFLLHPRIPALHSLSLSIATGPDASFWLEQFRNPFATGKAVTIAVAPDTTTLENSVDQLVQPEVWSSLTQSVAVWDPVRMQLACEDAGPRFDLGNAGIPILVSDWITRYVGLFFALLLVLSLLLAWAIVALMNRRWKRLKAEGMQDGRL